MSASPHATPASTAAATPTRTLVEVNGIEVIYNHVILVLKGVSLKGRCTPVRRTSLTKRCKM